MHRRTLDMRPSINPFAIEGEAPRYTTPALDELARTGTLFTRAYIQISYCAPSRNSFMYLLRSIMKHLKARTAAFISKTSPGI